MLGYATLSRFRTRGAIVSQVEIRAICPLGISDMSQSDYENLPAHLGNLVMAFDELEIALGGALMRILRNKDEFIGAVFISVLGFRQKYDLLKALAAKIDDKNLKGQFLETTARPLTRGRDATRCPPAPFHAGRRNSKESLTMTKHCAAPNEVASPPAKSAGVNGDTSWTRCVSDQHAA